MLLTLNVILRPLIFYKKISDQLNRPQKISEIFYRKYTTDQSVGQVLYNFIRGTQGVIFSYISRLRPFGAQAPHLVLGERLTKKKCFLLYEVFYIRPAFFVFIYKYTGCYTKNTFGLINRLADFSLVSKPNYIVNTGSSGILKNSKYIYSTTSLYSTSSKAKGRSADFFNKVYSDKSGNNPFFIVENFLKQNPNPDLAKSNLDYKLINTILSNHIKDFKLSEKTFDFLMKLTMDQPLKFDNLPLSESGKAYFQDKLGVTQRGVNSKFGVYLFINKITGESYVGSSGALASRIKNDYLRSGKILGKRPIELAISKYGLSNFKLEVYVLSQELLKKIYSEFHSSLTRAGKIEEILPKSQINVIDVEVGSTEVVENILKFTPVAGDFKKEIRNLVLVLEQIFILLLNPKYNKLKVAGSCEAGRK